VKFYFILILFLAFFFSAAAPISARELPQVMIVNQVRGTACCDAGTADTLQEQLDFLTEKQLPAFFTLRWDALNDPDFIKTIQQADPTLFSWGLFLEITPGLAAAAVVDYTGSADSWYQAQHAYTLGYVPSDRKKIVDTLMTKYQAVFGEYPALTTSWIIDTPTLNYLHHDYGVKVHQITREQWGTDSYTLYGGPPHYPYPASNNWALMPDYSLADPMLVVRQTLTDPVWNYGDTQSRFTSQPNDFSQDGKGFKYFEKLFDQALFEQSAHQTGFALLGLENSMADKYQQLFKKQLQLVADYHQQGKITLPSLTDLKSTWLSQNLTVYQGKDLVKNSSSQAFWITGQNYRLRLIKKDQQLCVDDLRLFDPQVEDYYASHKAQDLSYWVTPFLVDGSRFYTHEKSWFSQEYRSDGTVPLPDMVTQPECWQLPQVISAKNELSIEQKDAQTLAINYDSETGMTSLLFKTNGFKLPLVLDDARVTWSANKQIAYELLKNCGDFSCWYTPMINTTVFAQSQEIQTSSFLPEQRVGELSAANSKLYADNYYAVAGRNPVRIVFMPRDDQGVAVKLDSPPTIKTKVELITDPTSVLETDPQFYDFVSDEPMETGVKFVVDDQLELETTVYFAPNCKKNLKYCVQHPQQAHWFLKSWLGDKRRSLSKKIYKIRTY
jgi:hypothetical protein